MRIAVIGGGGAGLTTSWLLDENHEVTLYERDDRLGGHADTKLFEIDGQPLAIDSGFEFISDAMFPTFMRLLSLLEVPVERYPMLVAMFNSENGAGYLLPPVHGWRILPDGLTPRKVADLLRFTRIIRAAGPLMQSRDTSVTIARFLDERGVDEAYRRRFLYPYLQAGWGATVDDILAYSAYDVLKYTYFNMPETLIPHGWKEIVGGTRTYVQRLAESLTRTRVNLGAGVEAIERVADGFRVIDRRGVAEMYDHVVLATNAHQAAAALASLEGEEGLDGIAEARALLNGFHYFETRIAIHGDIRLMPPKREHWSTVNIRYDGTLSQFTVWRGMKHGARIFKSWVTRDATMPDPLYALATYQHPQVDTNYFALQKRLQAFQGQHNIWLAGMYMVDVDCHESAVLSGMRVAQQLAPDAPRLRQLLGRASMSKL